MLPSEFQMLTPSHSRDEESNGHSDPQGSGGGKGGCEGRCSVRCSKSLTPRDSGGGMARQMGVKSRWSLSEIHSQGWRK